MLVTMNCDTSQPIFDSHLQILSVSIEIKTKWLIPELQFCQKEVTKILSGNGNKNIETMDHKI